MSAIAIRAEGLSKKYRISAGNRAYENLRELLTDGFRNFLARDGARGGLDTVWALRDVSFEIPQGQIVGVIGRNGAGKSTLLKILSRITEPTEGRAEIHGRVGSLLEVGTGFHPELSGRENIYLNGAILGMRKREIDRKFDEILAFSETERFVDTPVKRYSSGMQVRLAFAVAAHLEPEILIVDEVLAVGDIAFQRKCLGKMSSVAQEGRTILFVSHNMSAIQNLCTRGILIRQGRLSFDGTAEQAVMEYLQELAQPAASPFAANPHRKGDGGFRFTSARALGEDGEEASHLVAGRPASFEFAYENRIEARQVVVEFTLHNDWGTAAANFHMDLTGYIPEGLPPRGRFICHIPILPLPLGEYRGAIVVRAGGRQTDIVPNAVFFRVASSTFFPTGRTPPPQFGACLVAHDWRHEPEAASKQG